MVSLEFYTGAMPEGKRRVRGVDGEDNHGALQPLSAAEHYAI